MNWGKGIAIALGSFMIFIIILASIMMSKSVDLEAEDYYKQEIEYQGEINAAQNANALREKVEISQHDEHIMVSIPDSLNCTELVVDLKRPNDEKLDRTYSPDNSKMILIPKSELKPGLYNVSISYKVGASQFLQRTNITVE